MLSGGRHETRLPVSVGVVEPSGHKGQRAAQLAGRSDHVLGLMQVLSVVAWHLKSSLSVLVDLTLIYTNLSP
jgi:hypothetical protein